MSSNAYLSSICSGGLLIKIINKSLVDVINYADENYPEKIRDFNFGSLGN